MALFLSALLPVAEAAMLAERIDLYDPGSGAFLGSESTYFGPDGRRLRLQIVDESGNRVLLFFVIHNDQGRESEAIYFERNKEKSVRERFSYSADGGRKTTTYYFEPGVASERTEADLDELGREMRKRYYRSDGTLYGEEDVLWNEDKTKLGWDFRYLNGKGGASFRYDYLAYGDDGQWLRRARLRDGETERLEVRTLFPKSSVAPLPTPARFAPGLVSSERSETSPSFSRDGKTMVFARYDDEWAIKDPFVASLEEDGWRVEELSGLGQVYDIAISPDARQIFYSRRSSDGVSMFRITRRGREWSSPDDLSDEWGISGSYPCLTDDGKLIFYDSNGRDGPGIYGANRGSVSGFGEPFALYVPQDGPPFDAWAGSGVETLIVTRCFDDRCLTSEQNGIWRIRLGGAGAPEQEKLVNLPYAWGSQPVPPLGIFVFTDGEDILALPLSVVDPPDPVGVIAPNLSKP